ncbi:sensor histidine kinase [Microbacterium sp. ZW T5_56]|uniref:sensor histidine kinase n=1 Tax=Microbacterium sp. ZW T5_56 TaxID=3378081 RepID=UPI003852D8EF
MSTNRASLVPTLLGDISAVAVIVLLGALPFPDEEFRAHGWQLVPALLPALALLLRRRAPLAVLGVILLCDLLLAATGIVGPSTLMALAISAYAVTDRLPRTPALVAVTSMVGIVFVANAMVLGGEPFDSRAMQFLAFIVAGAALGIATRSRRDYTIVMSERVERAERSREEESRRRVAEERVSIARDLHDLVAHQISVISLNAGVASAAVETKPERAREALSTIRSASRTVLADIGALLAVLRAEDPDDLRTLRPQPGLAERTALFERFRAGGLIVEVAGDEELPALTPAADHAAHFVLLEGLTNALKHGDHVLADVDFGRTANGLRITITNTVAGGAGPITSGHGLRGLRERVSAAGGHIETHRTARDFVLRAEFPLPAKGDQ